MKKIILAIENKKLLKKIKENKNIKIIANNLQYREAILEFLEKNNKIDFILISEKIPGEISVEKLIKKIKNINKKICIIFFLEKENNTKENKLKNLGIKNIYIIKKIKNKEIIELLEKKEIENIRKNETTRKILIEKLFNKKNKKDKKELKNKIISICGKKNVGKTTITFLFLIYLLEKNKKILLINFNKKIEKNYLILLIKIKNKLNKKNKNNKNKIKNIFKNSELKINNNLFFLKDFEKIMIKNNQYINFKKFLKHIKKFDFILFDIGYRENRKEIEEILENSHKILWVMSDKELGIKDLQDMIRKIRINKEREKASLHIIHNKYKFTSVSSSLLKKIFDKNIKYYRIFYQKNLINISKKFYQNKKIKINKILKFKITKILNNFN